MQYFKVSAAKNNEKIDLIVRYGSEQDARNGLHSQGYSILQIEQTEAPIMEEGVNIFYFEILVAGEKKTGQIHATDGFKAYKKLVDDLGYSVVYLTDKKDATEEEKMYSTVRARESYLLYKKETPVIKNEEVKTENLEKTEKRESLDPGSILWKEILRIQWAILRVSQKMEHCIQQYQKDIPEDKLEKIKALTLQLKQIRHITNVEKLRSIGEACLVKLGELEMIILQNQTGVKRSDFLKETNTLLKEIGSSKRIGTDRDEITQKIKGIMGMLGEAFSKKDTVAAVKTGIDKQSFLYLKNLRELGIYEDKLKEIRKEVWKNIFASPDIKNRLRLKARLLEQNIAIIRGRIQKKSFSYSRLVKGFSYYNKLLVWVFNASADVILYSVLLVLFLSQMLVYLGQSVVWFWEILFPLTLGIFFALIFRSVRSVPGVIGGSGIFFLVTFALRINF